MNSVREGLAIVVLSLGIVGLIVGPAASQTERDSEKVERKPNELRRLYPLDPEVGRKGRTQSDVPVPPSPAPAQELNGRSEVAPENAGSSVASPWLIAVTLAFAGALAFLAFRRSHRSAPSTQQTTMQRIQTDSGAPPDFEPAPADVEADPPLEMPPEPSLVRVHLRDGRIMDGAVKHAPTRDSPVLLLDVVGVSDAEGKERDPEPFDEFVPLIEIDHVESIEHTDERTLDPRRGQ
jgi:hypothetical protein